MEICKCGHGKKSHTGESGNRFLCKVITDYDYRRGCGCKRFRERGPAKVKTVQVLQHDRLVKWARKTFNVPVQIISCSKSTGLVIKIIKDLLPFDLWADEDRCYWPNERALDQRLDCCIVRLAAA